MADSPRFEPGLLTTELPPLAASRAHWTERTVTALCTTPEGGIPQHRLLVGTAGTGKSLLLRALERAFSGAGASTWRVARLPSELGEVLRLTDLWRAVRRALDRTDEDAATLREAAGGARVLLLIDDFDRVLARVVDEHWALREVLSSGDVALVGACRRLPEAAYAYDAAFYDFFAVDRLESFTYEAAVELLRVRTEPGIADALDHAPGVVRALHDLTAGNPRFGAHLGDALAPDGARTDAGEAIAHVLDRATPEHRAVLDALSDQTRAVLIALANAGEPAAASDIAARLEMPSNKVSAYLNRLGSDGLVEKVPLPDARTTGYQLVDRVLSLGCRARSGNADAVLTLARGMAQAWSIAFDSGAPTRETTETVFGGHADALEADPRRATYLPPELRPLARALFGASARDADDA